MISVKLTKVESTHNNLRTQDVVGETFELPFVGKSFVLYAEPLTSGADLRVVRTTPVTELIKTQGGGFEFRTANSLYHLEVKEGV